MHKGDPDMTGNNVPTMTANSDASEKRDTKKHRMPTWGHQRRQSSAWHEFQTWIMIQIPAALAQTKACLSTISSWLQVQGRNTVACYCITTALDATWPHSQKT